ncbi:MAG TPA: hypothetical protein VHW09_21970 [Bryobacteraceae bacterium]|jgi:hypothetical protein|nr:hypothetical protein [Bryobacteraceae bacterium]
MRHIVYSRLGRSSRDALNTLRSDVGHSDISQKWRWEDRRFEIRQHGVPCNTCDTDFPPSKEDIAKFRREFAKLST